jgi:hypothetical protein
MENVLRYTGCWPPIDVLAKYPNWIFALDEEGKPGQDETTIKPETQQRSISEETCFTAADAKLADGRVLTAIMRLAANALLGLDVFEEVDWWSLTQQHGSRWQALNETWLPAEERRPTVSLQDRRIFPLSAESRLPRDDGKHLTLRINCDGKAQLQWR